MEVEKNKDIDNLKADIAKFNERLTELLTEKSELIKSGIAIKAEYILKIGKYELKRYRLFFNIQKIRRKLALYQIALNRGEVLTDEEVDKIVEEDIKEYSNQLKMLSAQYEFAEEYVHEEKVSDEEYNEIKEIYCEILKKVHPDLNPNLSDEIKDLWEKAKAAYTNNDLAKLQEIKENLDSKDISINNNSFEKLEEQKLTLQRRIYEEKLRIKDMKNKFPYNKSSILEDEEMVKEIVSEIEEEIKQYEKIYQELQMRLDFIKDPQHGIS